MQVQEHYEMNLTELLFGRPLRTEEEQVEQIGPLAVSLLSVWMPWPPQRMVRKRR